MKKRQVKSIRLGLVSGVILGAILLMCRPAHATPTIIGALNNFDVYNETPDCEQGFEIELHGVSTADIVSTYGNSDYGIPHEVDVPGGVRVRYESVWDGSVFVTCTPVSAPEHFGVTLRRPASTIEYNWLTADPANPGMLTRSGTPVTLPQPVPTIDTSGPTPFVRTTMTNGTAGSDAVWVRRYGRAFNREVQLDELLVDNPVVMDTPALTGQFELVDGGASLLDDEPLTAGDAANIFVIEVYQYTGPYDDSHTPSCTGQCAGTMGALIGTVMTATNLAEQTAAAATSAACTGDCGGDGVVTVNELVVCVNMALGGGNACPACDANGDGMVTINEIVAAVNAALGGCPTPPVTFTEIQQTMFTPRCAMPGCHDAASKMGNLDLTAGSSYAQLVNVPPNIPSAAQAGLLRVSPGSPDTSFLMIKLQGPPPVEGSRMPLTGAPLSTDQIALIRDWILQGANP